MWRTSAAGCNEIEYDAKGAHQPVRAFDAQALFFYFDNLYRRIQQEIDQLIARTVRLRGQSI